MDVEILACPFCGWHHPVKQSRKKVERADEALPPEEDRGFYFGKVDPSKVLVYQVRRLSGAGRSSRNATIETITGLHLPELPDDRKDEIRQQAQRVLDALE